MLLKDKVAVVYGGSGAVGACISEVFLREGARLHIAARSRGALDRTAARLGGEVAASEVDVLDDARVSEHLREVVARNGRVDICVNAVNVLFGQQGINLSDMSADEYSAPIAGIVRANFNIAKAAAAEMRPRAAGVVLMMSAPVAVIAEPEAGSYAMAFAAVEEFTRQFAAEEGEHGLRIVALRPTGMPDSVERGSNLGKIWRNAAERSGVPFDDLLANIGAGTYRKRPISVTEVAEVAAFAVSERASAINGTVLNVSGGAIHD